MKELAKTIALDKRLEGGRILVRHFLSTSAPLEKYVREFTADGKLVRLSRSNDAKDPGLWSRVAELRVEALLEERRAQEPGFRMSEESEGDR